jgi:hypothetical protein
MKKGKNEHHENDERLDAHALRQVAAAALCDPGTVARYVGGGSVRGLSARRIAAALQKLGLGARVRREDRERAMTTT